MFIGRSAELKQMSRLYANNDFQCIIIWGRRRVGKTTLINQFIKDKPTVYFTATESTAKDNLEAFSKSIGAFTNHSLYNSPLYQNYEDALNEIFLQAQMKQLLLVIDEYPYLAKAYNPISSILQKLIDKYSKSSKLYIILCGSSMSFMEHQVLGYQSPLYGRRTAQLEIKPFNFFEYKDYYKHFSKEDLALVYGITGGIPQYMKFFNDSLSIKENIINNFLTPSGYLYEEPENLLKQELREPAIYNAIIRAIATGSSKSSEISSKVGVDSSKLAIYVDKLIELGIVCRENPIGEKSKRKVIYSIRDGMFNFWYRFIPANNLLIQRNKSIAAWNNIEPQLNTYMGHIFEQICQDYLWQVYDMLPLPFQQIGRWWGTNPKLKRQEEIDIVATDETTAIVCECKWRKEKVDVQVLNTLTERALLLPYTNLHYFIFSKSGFTKECILHAKELRNTTLLTYSEILKE